MPNRAARLAPWYFVASTAALVWPIYPALGDAIEPRVLGLPWSLVYVLLVIAANAAVLIALYVARAYSDEPGEQGGG